MPQIK